MFILFLILSEGDSVSLCSINQLKLHDIRLLLHLIDYYINFGELYSAPQDMNQKLTTTTQLR